MRIAAEAGEELGLAIVGRGFDVTVAVPFGAPLSDGLRHAARRCAEACPTGAIALRTPARATWQAAAAAPAEPASPTTGTRA